MHAYPVAPDGPDAWEEELTQRYSVPPAEISRRPLGRSEPSSLKTTPESGIAVLRQNSKPRPRLDLGPARSVQLVPLEVLRALMAGATEYLGPSVRPLVSAELRRLGVTAQSLPWTLLPTLIASLTARLDTAHAVSSFSRSVQLAHPDLRNYWER